MADPSKAFTGLMDLIGEAGQEAGKVEKFKPLEWLKGVFDKSSAATSGMQAQQAVSPPAPSAQELMAKGLGMPAPKPPPVPKGALPGDPSIPPLSASAAPYDPEKQMNELLASIGEAVKKGGAPTKLKVTPDAPAAGQLGGTPSYLQPQTAPLSKPTYPYQPLKTPGQIAFDKLNKPQAAPYKPPPFSTLPPSYNKPVQTPAQPLSLVQLPKPQPAAPSERLPTAAALRQILVPPKLVDKANKLGLNTPAFHATMKNFSEFKFNGEIGKNPDIGIHFGTLRAGLDRLKHTGAKLDPVDLERRFAKGEGIVKDPSGLALQSFEHAAPAWKVIPAQIGINKPLQLPDLGTWGPKNMRTALGQMYPEKFTKAELDQAMSSGDPTTQIRALRKLIKSKGYDGIKYKNSVEDPGSTSYILLNPSKARSFYANFDPAKAKSANIGYAIAGMSLVPLGLFESIGQAKAAEGQMPSNDDVFNKPPTGAAIGSGGTEAAGASEAMSLMSQGLAPEEPKKESAIPGKTAGTIGEFAGQWAKDIYGVAKEGYADIKKGGKTAWENLSKETMAEYNAYQKEYERWNDLPDLEKQVVPPPKPPEHGGGAAFLHALLTAAGGVGTIAASPGLGLVRTGAGRPLEEKYGVPHEVTEFVGGIALPMAWSKFGTSWKAVKPIISTVTDHFTKVLAPEKIGKGEKASAIIRMSGGTAARDEAITRDHFDQYWNAIDNMPRQEQLGLTAYIEGRTGGAKLHDPQLQGPADEVRDAMKLRRTKLENLPSTSQMGFVQDYLPHLWKDPTMAKKFYGSWYAGKQGSGASLKKRSLPTVADGIAAGLEPISYNPLEMGLRYVQSMDKYIQHNAIFDVGRATKDIKFFRNQGTHEQPFSRVAEKLGLVPLQGRLGTRHTKYGDMIAWAHPDFARVYNNFVGKGFHGIQGPYGEDISKGYDTLRHGSNSLTALELAFSGFHFGNILKEGFLSDLQLAASKGVGVGQAMRQGDMAEAVRLLGGSAYSAAHSILSPIATPFRGWKGQNIYLDRSPGSANNRELIDYLEKAGGRAVGYRHAQDYETSAAGSYLDSFHKLSDVLDKHAYQSLGKSLKADYAAGKIGGRTVFPAPVAFLGRQLSRTMQSIMDPLFKFYIPKMKTGAFMENMRSWLNANPTASEAEKVQMARRIWDSMDNRMGEMVHDNIFWPQMLKQAAMLGMRSYSWTYGTIRELGGGAGALATGPVKHTGIRGMEYDPKAGYVLGLVMGSAILDSAYQYMKTGKGPESIDDLMHPRTGGKIKVGGKEVEERATLPGQEKDVYGWYNDWKGEARNKLSEMASIPLETIQNQDWRGDPILRPEGSAPQWMKDYFHYLITKMMPIQAKQEFKKGTNIGWERYFGVSEAGARWTRPDWIARIEHSKARKLERTLKHREKRHQEEYGGTE